MIALFTPKPTSDLNLYYDGKHTQWYKRPDWFAVLGVSRFSEQTELRLSYVTWCEGTYPFVVVELISPETENEGHWYRLARSYKRCNTRGSRNQANLE
jgi:Uma2 family endonuclease